MNTYNTYTQQYLKKKLRFYGYSMFNVKEIKFENF